MSSGLCRGGEAVRLERGKQVDGQKYAGEVTGTFPGTSRRRRKAVEDNRTQKRRPQFEVGQDADGNTGGD